MNPVIPEIMGNKRCRNCILSGKKDYVFVRNETLKINAHYAPNKIIVLLVSESPPWAYLQDHSAYFYAPGQIKRSGLSYHIMSVLFKEKFSSKECFLQKFTEKGFYLIDMVKCPINKLPRWEKEKATKSCANYLNKELHSLNFKKAIFIGKSSFKIIKNHLELDFNYAVIPLPFGSNINVQNFRKQLETNIIHV